MHLKTKHGITCEDYFSDYLCKNTKNTCSYVKCENTTTFINLSSGYNRFCSNVCYGKQSHVDNPEKCKNAGKALHLKNPDTYKNMRNGFLRYIKENPEHQSKAGKIGGKIGGVNVHKTHPDLARKNGISSMLKLQKKNFFSIKKNMHVIYRSKSELKFFQYLEFSNSVVDYIYEPFVIAYNKLDGKTASYIPDVLVIYDNGDKHLIELKDKKPNSIIDRLKFNSATKYCSSNGIAQFEVLYGCELIKYMFKYSTRFDTSFMKKLMGKIDKSFVV